jgi:hypothetical protein
MAVSPIRIPIEEEFQFLIGGRSTGTPIETNREWESTIYEVWSPYRTYEHIIFQIDMLRSEICYHTLKKMFMSEEVFLEKKNSILKAITSISDFLDQNVVYHKVVIDNVRALISTAAQYSEAQR